MYSASQVTHIEDKQHTDICATKTSTLLGVSFANIDLSEAIDLINQELCENKTSNLYFINTHCLNIAYKDAEYRHALDQADHIFPDGSGVKIGCALKNDALVENLNGTDLFPKICAQVAAAKQSIYLLGAEPGVAEQVADWVRSHFSDLHVAGTHHGYFDESDNARIIKDINDSGADVLFVAMGVPTQEMWLHKHKNFLSTKLNIAVGGLFEFYSSRIPRAPLWMRQAGLEWICRLYHEPARMWKRYIIGNPLYVLRVMRETYQNNRSKAQTERLASQKSRLFAEMKSSFLRRWFHVGLWSDRSSKRMTDLILSIYALVVLLPIFLLVALAIKIDSKGPVFFTQDRAGYRGRPFKMWKFRSMYIDAEERRAALLQNNEMSSGVTFKMKDDPRVTRVGKFIRKYSIDELPQLFNIVAGDMSVVGPRPALFCELTQYEISQRARLDTVPGLTSEWVVAGRSNIDFQQQALLDIDYVKRRSFWTDLKLILKTIPIVLTGRGAC